MDDQTVRICTLSAMFMRPYSQLVLDLKKYMSGEDLPHYLNFGLPKVGGLTGQPCNGEVTEEEYMQIGDLVEIVLFEVALHETDDEARNSLLLQESVISRPHAEQVLDYVLKLSFLPKLAGGLLALAVEVNSIEGED